MKKVSFLLFAVIATVSYLSIVSFKSSEIHTDGAFYVDYTTVNRQDLESVEMRLIKSVLDEPSLAKLNDFISVNTAILKLKVKVKNKKETEVEVEGSI
jgi:hypothetical protein